MTKHTAHLFNKLLSVPLSAPGVTPSETRKRVAERAGSPPGEGPEIAGPAGRYVDKVAHAPYKVTDEDWQRMRQGGMADEEIFELTIAAALGAARRRLDAGLAALGVSE